MALATSRSTQVTRLTHAAWDSLLSRMPGYPFFATPLWATILDEAGLGYRCHALALTAEDAAVLMPVATRRDRLGLNLHISMPFATYGGPFLVNGRADVSLEWRAQIIDHFKSSPRFGGLFVFPGPYPHVPLPTTFDMFTAQVIELTSPDPPSAEPGLTGVLANLRPKTRQYINRAVRNGVSVRWDNSRASFEAYYALLLASARRWGRRDPGKPWSLFEAIWRRADPSSVKLWLAEVRGELAAGLLCFYGRGEVFAWSGAMHIGLSADRPNYLLHWRVLEAAAEQNIPRFNLGASTELEGVAWFKQGFGTKSVHYPAYVVASPVYRCGLWLWRGARGLRARLPKRVRALAVVGRSR